MSSSSNISRSLSVRNTSTRSSSPVECLLKRTRSLHHQHKKDQSDGFKISPTINRFLETPVRLITQSSLSLSLPKLYPKSPRYSYETTSDRRSVSPPRPGARLWKSRSVRRSPGLVTVSPRNVHFHVTSCTRCLSRGTTTCYCNYVPRSDNYRLSTDFFTLASAYPRVPDSHTSSSRYTSSSLRRRTLSLSSLHPACSNLYEPKARASTSIDRVKLYY